MKSRLIIIILLVFSLSTEAQVRRTTIRAFWQTVRNTISGETPTPPTVEKSFYVSSSSGSDSNPGTLTEPFQTLDKINSLALTDTSKVYLKRGDSFIGTLRVQSDSITYDAYGTGANPKIYGSEIITGWTLHSGSIFKATHTTNITQIFNDGERLTAARLTNSGYSTITDSISQTVATIDAASQAANYYQGCTVVVRGTDYTNEYRTITSSTGSKITINSTVFGKLNTGQGMLLMGKLEFLDAPGEWFYDSAADLIYIWMPDSDSPALHEIRGSTISDGISISNKSYITINNLNILHQTNKGIEVTTSTNNNITVQNCNISGQGNFGIGADPGAGSNWLIENNTFSDIPSTALYGYRIGNSIIQNNTFTDIGLFEDWGIVAQDGLTDGGNAIEFSDPNLIGLNTIQYNTVVNSGYNGLIWRGETIIQYNYFQNIGLAKADGGAIYTGSPTASGSIVRHNIIDGSIGTMVGFTKGRNYGFGIYIDEGANNVTVEYNTIYNISDAGIFLHKPSNHTIRYNKVLNSRYGFMTANTSSGTSYFNNNFLATGSDADDYEPRQLVVREATNGTVINTNTYVSGFTSDIVFRASDGSYKNFADWKTFSSQDAASSYIGTSLAGRSQRLVYNNTTDTLKYYLNEATSATNENATAIPDSFLVAPFEAKYVRSINVDSISIIKKEIVPIDLTGNLLANYDFSETSGTVSNDLIGSADGTVAGGPVMDGTKYTFDGINDNVLYPLPSVITASTYNNDFSINLKFSLPSIPSATKRIFYQGFNVVYGVQIAINNAGSLYGIITESTTPTTSGRLRSTGLSTATNYNVTLTWDATAEVLRMYLDGTEITAPLAPISYGGNSAGMLIGSTVGTGYINADVYELSVFDKKLSDIEVSAWINR